MDYRTAPRDSLALLVQEPSAGYGVAGPLGLGGRVPGETRMKPPTWNITIRPWNASGGSSVHDEMAYVRGKTAHHAIMNFYGGHEARGYDFTIWRIIDVTQASSNHDEVARAVNDEG